MPLPIESLSPELAAAAKRVKADLQRAAAKNLAGLILHGFPAAGRRYRDRVLKVVVILHNASEEKLAAIEPVIRNTWKTIPIEMTVLTPEEVTSSWKESFAIKFLDIRNRYVVLAGTDPFAEIKLSRPHVRQQVVHNLQKLLLRLRRDRLDMGRDESQLAGSLAKFVRPFARQLIFLLQACGHALPANDRPGIIFAAAAPLLGLDVKVLKRLTRVRRSRPTAKSVASLYERVLAALARAADFAAGMKEPGEGPPREVHAAGEASNVSAAAT